MIPAAFDYVAPATLDEAMSRLSSEGEDAKLLAGGHSLLPLMKLRLAYPSILIDLGKLNELRYIREADGAIEIGAMTPYAEIERSDTVRRLAPMLSQACGLVGDAQVRHRGTIGGSLVHADPAGDLPTVFTALDGAIQTRSTRGTREIAAGEFFTGIFETALEPDEIVTGVRIPSSGSRQHYEKFRRRLCDWAIVGSSVALQLDDGHIRSGRVVLTNVATTPAIASSVEEALTGSATDEASLARAAENAADGLDPTPELNGSADYKRHLARVITRRALVAAVGSGSAT